MKPGITIRKIDCDEDVLKLEVTSCDGESFFRAETYAGDSELKELIKGLTVFRNHLYGGLYNIRLGEFGSEYAGGGFEARLHFQIPGTLFITVRAESEWRPFKKAEVASHATLYMKTEPVLLENFIEDLGKLDRGETNEASLSCTIA